MRWFFLLLASLFAVSGCAISGAGTEESIAFSPDSVNSVAGGTVYKPYESLALTLEFSCPGKVYSAMISPVIPLPPVVPVGFVNQKESFVKIVFPEDGAAPIQSIHVVLANGDLMQLQRTAGLGRTYKTESGFLTYVQFKTECAEFDGGEMQIEGFEYLGKLYPPAKARLQFKSTFKVDWGYWRS